ncbi:hypothetical protein [Micromonospora sp. NPDC092111]|uniref:hypothetical protein n=1 Tax=Micromonospora sp. NPDC092111 TaxID=3364289 RepID=UPI003804470A
MDAVAPSHDTRTPPLVGPVLTALQEAHQDERAAARRTSRPEPGDQHREPSVQEQLAQLHAIRKDLERQLPEAAYGRPVGRGSPRRKIAGRKLTAASNRAEQRGRGGDTHPVN